VDRFIIGKWLGATQLGLYDKSLTLGVTPYNAIIMNINAVMFTSFSSNKGDISQLKESFMKSVTLVSFINFPIHLGLIIIAPYFVTSMLGIKWVRMIQPFQIILMALLFKSFDGLSASLNVGLGKYKEHTMRTLYAFIMFTIVCFMFIKQGIIGIAMSYLVYCLFNIFLVMNLSMKAIRLNYSDVFRSTLPAMLSSVIMFFITFLSSILMFKNYSLINMIFIILIELTSYILAILFNKSPITKEFKVYLVRDLKKYYKNKLIR
jgi:O-antigen/teichoic acid export membrane protein